YPIEQVDPSWKSIPYGRPMANQRFYVLDGVLEPCPVWVPGQLYIGGMGLANGYWRDEQKTNASFMIHPHTKERLYKTGDLGRYLPDGNIEFQGREDCQVKVNGYRIELGEIEATLQQHPAVKETVVTAVGELRENQQLVAYIVPKSGEFEAERADFYIQKWRDFLQKKLPDYMMPADFILLDALPLTSNGKVNRRALPAPKSIRSHESAAYVKPQTDAERLIAAVWQEILQIEQVGIHDNFFELGGNSLLLVKMQVKLQEIFGQELSMIEIIKSPNIDSLAKFLSQEQSRKTAAQQGHNRGEARSALKTLSEQRKQSRQKQRSQNN
ncbi:MAG TPA: non-ribosomal peptide synthetase, partial [Cyanobacteria bacterium UBA11368]|nr:non-ribosomal peptide synthetase [Cyanobacteria bacterium UBA11368]